MQKLSINNFNLLVKISIKHKLDWFHLKHDDECDVDYVVDIENNEVLSLKDAILMLDDCLVMCDMDYLTEKEKRAYKRLVKKAGNE